VARYGGWVLEMEALCVMDGDFAAGYMFVHGLRQFAAGYMWCMA
jgi:hypothetical protein